MEKTTSRYLFYSEGPNDIFWKQLCLDQCHLHVSVDLCVIWPVLATLNLQDTYTHTHTNTQRQMHVSNSPLATFQSLPNYSMVRWYQLRNNHTMRNRATYSHTTSREFSIISQICRYFAHRIYWELLEEKSWSPKRGLIPTGVPCSHLVCPRYVESSGPDDPLTNYPQWLALELSYYLVHTRRTWTILL